MRELACAQVLCALMATGHAKFAGQVGVCLATQGPGAIHLLNGLYDARLDHQPVVAIIGQQPQMSMGTHDQQEVDLVTLFKDLAGEYVRMVTRREQVRHVIDRAFRGRMLSIRYPTEVNLVGDSAETLKALPCFCCSRNRAAPGKRAWRSGRSPERPCYFWSRKPPIASTSIGEV